MLNAANTVDIIAPQAPVVAPRRVSRFTPRDPEQVVFRRMLSKLDENQLLTLETDLEYYLSGGEMTRHLSSIIDAGAVNA